jgi:Bacterial Ig-like domain (group 3)/FG-GAP-like repeat
MPANKAMKNLSAFVFIAGMLAGVSFWTGCRSSSEWADKDEFASVSPLEEALWLIYGGENFYDPAPLNSPPIPNVPYRPFLTRQGNCSLTRYAFDASGNLLSTYPNYQDYLHFLSGLSTTPDQFSNGCKDPTIAIMSQQAFSLGAVANGNLAGGIISTDGVSVGLVNGTTLALLSTTDYPGIPSPNPDLLTPQAVTAADLNHDGIVDAIVVDAGSGNLTGTVAVFLGNGDGTLKTPTMTPLPILAGAVTVEDINNDGKLDLVVLGLQPPTFNSGTIVTLLGNGDGTFQAPILGPSLARGSQGAGVAVIADFNHDGNKDIATSMGQILLGNGDGTFTLMSQLAFASPNGVVNGLAAGDLNHDGKIDLAVSNPLGDSIDIYLGNGNGTFVFKASYATMFGAQTVTITDLDGDGNQDIFVGAGQAGTFGQDANTHGVFQSLLGRGDGTFVAAVNYSASSSTFGSNAAEFGSGFDIADFNGDGKPDIVRIDANSSGPLLSVLTGQSDGSFLAGPQTPITLAGTFEGLVAADVNRDGTPDVVFTSSDTLGTSGGSVNVVFGKGDGTFQIQAKYAVAGVITDVAVTDVNGDGLPDIIAATGFWPDYAGGGATTQLYLLLNNGDGTFKPPTLIDSKPYLFKVAAKDVNGDGRVDLVVTAGGNIPANIAGALYLYLGNGDGTFQPATLLSISGSSFPAGVDIADVNADGKSDVVITDFRTGNLLILLGNGDGTFQSSIVMHTSNREFSDIGIADFDGDGKPDILLTGFVAVGLRGNGDGTFGAPVPLFTAPQSSSVKLLDINGDGHPDILITSGPAGLHAVLSSARAVAAGGATTTTLATSASSITFGQSVTLTATVAPTSGTSIPSGSVSFTDNGTALANAPLNSSGVATLSTTSLAVGTHSITAVYSGDVNFTSSTSAAATIVVSPLNNTPPVANAGPSQTVECSNPSGTPVTLNGSASTDPDGDQLTYVWKNAAGTIVGDTVRITQTLPLGTFTYSLIVTDSAGLSSIANTSVTVRDSIPPVVNSSVALPTLMQNNHNLVNVGLAATTHDTCTETPSVMVKVFGNEDDQMATDAQGTVFSPDAKNIAPGTLRLRAERSDSGQGRVYLIVIKATDSAGNFSLSVNSVVVPYSSSTASIKKVNSLAAAARAFALNPANKNNPEPPGYFIIGDGPVIGPKQ